MTEEFYSAFGFPTQEAAMAAVKRFESRLPHGARSDVSYGLELGGVWCCYVNVRHPDALTPLEQKDAEIAILKEALRKAVAPLYSGE